MSGIESDFIKINVFGSKILMTALHSTLCTVKFGIRLMRINLYILNLAQFILIVIRF